MQQLPFLHTSVRSATISDSLDLLNLRSEVMKKEIRGLHPHSRAYGFARTIEFVESNDYVQEDPYGEAIDFIDSLRQDDLVVIATGSSNKSAFWGELFSAAAQSAGARGAVCDGPVRDTAQIERLNFPVFADGHLPFDYKGRMKISQTDQTVICGTVIVNMGDFVFADCDGIVVVPHDNIAECLELANQRAATENHVLKDLLRGQSVREVWDKYHVL